MSLPLHLWLPRAVIWLAVIFIVPTGVLWYAAPNSNDLLGVMGGIWAMCRVAQFLLMTRPAQKVLIFIGGNGRPRSEFLH
jgi:hypothetical protein